MYWKVGEKKIREMVDVFENTIIEELTRKLNNGEETYTKFKEMTTSAQETWLFFHT